MAEDLPPKRRDGRAVARDRPAARRRRVRAIRRRVAGMSLATFLAASGAVVVQIVSGGQSARGHATRTAAAATSGLRSTSDAGSSAASHTSGFSRSASQTPGSAVSPTAVTTSAS
jgi:hypothetical protein